MSLLRTFQDVASGSCPGQLFCNSCMLTVCMVPYVVLGAQNVRLQILHRSGQEPNGKTPVRLALLYVQHEWPA
jgi:hypothetical protein